MRIRKSIRDGRRGSTAVETAILLPLFVIGILTIGYLLKFCMVSEGVQHALTDEAHRIMTEAAYIPYPAFGEHELVKRIADESRGEARDVKADRFFYRVPGVSKSGRLYTDLIAISVSFETPLKLPRLFLSEVKGERTALCRAFVGMKQDGSAMPFSDMEQRENGKTVWVFPRAGEKYHGELCPYIDNHPREVLLDRAVRGKYNPCKLCKPAERRDGTLVYCFPSSGRVYHLGECYIVERYVIEIGQEDAEAQGYRSCSKCGGG